MIDDVTLVVGGRRWRGWETVDIRLGLDQGAGTYSLSLTDRWDDDMGRRAIHPGEVCRIDVGGDRVITGYVDDVAPAYDSASRSLKVTGRDAVGQLVDCSAVHDPGEWKGLNIERIAADLCRPFGVDVRAEADVGAAFASFRIQEGETVFAAIERMARHRALLPASDGLGNLILTRAGGRRSATALRRGPGGNILKARAGFSLRDRYSRYIVKGQAEGSDWGDPAADHAGPKGEARDPAVRLHRPLVVLAEDQGAAGDFQARADWEARVRMGRATAATVTVQGWRDGAGSLWRPNTLVWLECDWLRISREMLIAGVDLARGAGGSTSEIHLVHPAAFDRLALPEDDAGDAAW